MLLPLINIFLVVHQGSYSEAVTGKWLKIQRKMYFQSYVVMDENLKHVCRISINSLCCSLDIGTENISRQLKLSSVWSFYAVSNTGTIHGDMALRNIVQSMENLKHAKITILGRAGFSGQIALENQGEELKDMLGV